MHRLVGPTSLHMTGEVFRSRELLLASRTQQNLRIWHSAVVIGHAIPSCGDGQRGSNVWTVDVHLKYGGAERRYSALELSATVSTGPFYVHFVQRVVRAPQSIIFRQSLEPYRRVSRQRC